jgi:hypothetical protein
MAGLNARNYFGIGSNPLTTIKAATVEDADVVGYAAVRRTTG